MDGLPGGGKRSRRGGRLACMGVSIEPWEIAARNLQAQTMPAPEHHARRPQLDVNCGRNRVRRVRLWVERAAPNAVRYVVREAVRMHVDELCGEISRRRRCANE